MRIMFYISVILVSLSFTCKNSNYKENYDLIEKWIGKKVIIPSDSLKIKVINDKLFGHTTLFRPDKMKLIVAINGECGSCVYKLKEIENFADKILYSFDISLLIYINSESTNFKYFETLNEAEIRFKYPLLYDLENMYLKKNNFPSNDFYHMVLCNKDNEILLIGDFSKSEELEEIYFKKIKEHAKPLIFDYPRTCPK